MRASAHAVVSRPDRHRLGDRLRPRTRADVHVGRDALGGRIPAADRARRALPDADAGRLGRGRRADRGGRVGAAPRTRVDVGHRRRSARALAPAARGRRPHARRDQARLRGRRGGARGLAGGANRGTRGDRAPALDGQPADATGRAPAAAGTRRAAARQRPARQRPACRPGSAATARRCPRADRAGRRARDVPADDRAPAAPACRQRGSA